MARKPFIVSVELEIGVIAENEDEIRQTFQLSDMFKDEINNAFIHGSDVFITPFNRMPDGWDLSSILYSITKGLPDVAVKEALEMEHSVRES